MKIALISSNPHDRIGGTEMYARNLIRSFAGIHSFTEYPIMKNGEKNSKLDKRVKIDYSLIGWGPDDLIWARTYKRKTLKKIYEENDVVILNNVFPPRKLLKHKKTILVQHMDTNFYTFRGKPFWLGVGSFFSWAFFGVGGTIGNPFKKANRVIFFDKTTETKTESKKYYIPLPSEQGKVNNNKEGYLWISRLDNPQKNVKDAVFIANKVKGFKIYGDGPYKKKMIETLNSKNSYGGVLTHESVIKKLNKSKALIVTSNWEGFPFIISESISQGTPVILYDTFKSVEFFKRSKMIKVAKDKNEIVELISKGFNLAQTNFAKEKLSFESFKKSWSKILKEVNDEN